MSEPHATDGAVEGDGGEIPQPPTLSNFRFVYGKDDKGKATETAVGLSAPEILKDLSALSDGWPARVGKALFVRDGNRGPLWLTRVTDLFGWCQSLFPDRQQNAVQWAERGPGMLSRSEFDAFLRQRVTRYESVESAPHEPAIPGHYYIHPPVAGGDGKALHGLLKRFSPHEDEDADLILAFFLTLVWGGPYGHRPAFLFTGPDADELMGRGVGKTTIVRLAARLFGGTFDVRPTDQWNEVLKRLLSDTDCSTQRVILIDNVKTHRFSWSDIESLITAERINGRKMFVGDGARPNTFTVAITLNGASLSKDLAQRCVIVKLDRPTYAGEWEAEATAYIDAHRAEIVGDLMAHLRRPVNRLELYSRWGLWERAILARLPEPARLQKLIADRRDAVDDDAEEAHLIRDAIADELRSRGHGEPDQCAVRIPAKTMAEIVNHALGERLSTTAVATKLKALGGAIKELDKRTFRGRRTWVWTGEGHRDATPEPLRDRTFSEPAWR
jgi:hypothetical protein